jgi:hypothetical protein
MLCCILFSARKPTNAVLASWGKSTSSVSYSQASANCSMSMSAIWDSGLVGLSNWKQVEILELQFLLEIVHGKVIRLREIPRIGSLLYVLAVMRNTVYKDAYKRPSLGNRLSVHRFNFFN